MTVETTSAEKINQLFKAHSLDVQGVDQEFVTRFHTSLPKIQGLFQELYGVHEEADFQLLELLKCLIQGYQAREEQLRERDRNKAAEGYWFLSQHLAGMSLYVDRFAGNLETMPSKLSHLQDLGVNFLHLMPLFESPQGESDGGYAVSNFRKVDPRFGSLEDLIALRKTMHDQGMYLMLDIVLNHTSHQHDWALKAKAGEQEYQNYYYTYENRWIPNEFEQAMPEIFPESAPGNFTWNEEMKRWVMTVFHNYQWDLNFSNPKVLQAMVENMLFYANLGVDLLRIDAPAFIWKQTGTSC